MEPDGSAAFGAGTQLDGSAERCATTSQEDGAEGRGPFGSEFTDLTLDDFCANIFSSSAADMVAQSTTIVADVGQARGFTLPLDPVVSLCVMRFYGQLHRDAVVALVSSLVDHAGTQRFLSRMARDALRVLPATPASDGTLWQYAATSALAASTPLRTVSRAMHVSTWDLSDTISVEFVASSAPSAPHHRITYRSPPPYHSPPLPVDASLCRPSESHAERLAPASGFSPEPPVASSAASSSFYSHTNLPSPRDSSRASVILPVVRPA